MSRLVLVLGAHRSGTSLVARSLECLGVGLGPKAIWNGPDNPRGFFENRDVLAINVRLLSLMDSAWDDTRPIKRLGMAAVLDPDIVELGRIAEMVLRAELARYPVFGIKEPRLCRLLPFWKPVFEKPGCQVSVVHVKIGRAHV